MLQVNAEIKVIRKLICGLDQKLTRPQKVVKNIYLHLCTGPENLRKEVTLLPLRCFGMVMILNFF